MKPVGRVILAATLLLPSVGAAGAADTASITDKSDDGAYIGLDDGTKWIVAAPDRSISGTWVVGDDVVVVDDSKNCSDAEIINTDESGDAVCAKQID